MISDEQYSQLEMLALAGMTPRECAVYFEADADVFENLCNDDRTLYHHHYHKGKMKAEVELNMKIHDSAMNGNAAMVNHYQQIMRAKQIEGIKQKHLYGED